MKKSALLLLSALVLTSGCFDVDKPYSTASDVYAMGWVVHNINNQTNATLSYSPEDLAVYNYSLNYPAEEPHEYANYLYWVAPVVKGGWSIAIGSISRISAPVDRVYYVMGKNPVPENYDTNWSFANYMMINYRTSEDENEQYAYDISHEEHYRSEDAFNAINPSPGDRLHVYFGTAPYVPTSVFVSENHIRLRNHLLRGYDGKSYLLGWSITLTDLLTGEILFSYTPLPTYQIYLNNSLVEGGNLTPNGVWDYTTLNYSLSSDGLYFINITIPSDYSVWNITRILAYFRKPSPDLSPPALERIDVSPKFRINEPLRIEVNASDESNVSDVRVYFNTGWGEDNWSELPVGVTNSLYNTSVAITDDSAYRVNLKVNVTDAFNNSVAYIILPASLRERSISLNLSSDRNSTKKGSTVWVGGECKDGFNLSCGGLRLEYYIGNSSSGVDVTNWSYEAAGQFGSYLKVPYNLTSTKANISVLFRGTGVYPSRMESLSLDVATYDHDLAVSSLTLSDFRLNERGDVNATVYNIGLYDEANVQVTLLVNGSVNGSVLLPLLVAGQSASVRFNWTPTAAGNHSLTVYAEAVDGETSVDDNSVGEDVVVGSDLEGVIIASWDYKFLVNKSTPVRIRLWNNRNETALNPAIKFYDVYGEEGELISYEGTTIVTFGGETYSITATKLSDSTAAFGVSYGSSTEEHALFEGQFVELGNGVLFNLNYVDSDGAKVYLENVSSSVSRNLSNIDGGKTADAEVNWTPNILGWHTLRLFINASNDADNRNNYGESSVEVIRDLPDVSGGLSLFPSPMANATANITVSVYNQGARNASNVTVRLLQKQEDEANYTLIGERPISKVVVDETRGFILNWTPAKTGTHDLRLEVNCSEEDGDPTDNTYDTTVYVYETLTPDAYEGDDSTLNATPTTPNGIPQQHNFYPAGDADWIKFQGTSGLNYVIETSNLIGNTDTIIYLYDTDGETLLDYNDDYEGLASRITLACTHDGTYYVRVNELSENIGVYQVAVRLSGIRLNQEWNLISVPLPD
jgi:hypothetical protein